MCILEGRPLRGEQISYSDDSMKGAEDPEHCVAEAGPVALRIAGMPESFEATAKARASLAKLLSAAEQDAASTSAASHLKESVAERRLRANWPGVLACAELLLADRTAPARHLREAFALASIGTRTLPHMKAWAGSVGADRDVWASRGSG